MGAYNGSSLKPMRIWSNNKEAVAMLGRSGKRKREWAAELVHRYTDSKGERRVVGSGALKCSQYAAQTRTTNNV